MFLLDVLLLKIDSSCPWYHIFVYLTHKEVSPTNKTPLRFLCSVSVFLITDPGQVLVQNKHEKYSQTMAKAVRELVEVLLLLSFLKNFQWLVKTQESFMDMHVREQYTSRFYCLEWFKINNHHDNHGSVSVDTEPDTYSSQHLDFVF